MSGPVHNGIAESAEPGQRGRTSGGGDVLRPVDSSRAKPNWSEPEHENFCMAIYRRFAKLGGAELDLPPREPLSPAPKFD